MLEDYKKYEFPKLGYTKIPKMVLSKKELKRFNLDENYDSNEYLRLLTDFKFKEAIKSGKVPQDKTKEYRDRLDYELGEIQKLCFTDYIILVYHIINYCNENDILTGYGRGSVGGSLLGFILGFIKADALKYGMWFERFISAARTETKEFEDGTYILSSALPDVDCDIQASKKHLLNTWLEKHFEGKVAAISNISTFQSKVTLKECSKWLLGYDEDKSKVLGDLIETKFGKVDSLEDSYKSSEKFKEWADANKECYEMACQIYELNKNTSIHASGVLISNDILFNSIPLTLDSDKEICTVGDMNTVQFYACKLDCLGLKCLDTLDVCLKKIGKKLSDIDIEDPSIYEYLKNTEANMGLFQAEEGLGKQVLKMVKPDNIFDLAMAISLNRPGSMGFINDVKASKFEGKTKKWHPIIDKILEKTYGCIIYQENIMSICREVGGFDAKETDKVRKAIGKKLVKEMASYKDKFISQSISRGFEKIMVEEIWAVFEASGNYLFNFSHAVFYSNLLAACAYLKANHKKEFYYGLLVNSKNEAKPIEEISKISKEMKNDDIILYRPSFIYSGSDFEIYKDGISIGISNIKGISVKAQKKLAQFKISINNKLSIFKAAEAAEIPTNIFSSLVLAGSMDEFLNGDSRSKLLLEYTLWKKLTDKEQALAEEYFDKSNNSLFDTVKYLNEEARDLGDKPLMKDSRRETLKKHIVPYWRMFKQNEANVDIAYYFFERELLGFAYTNTLLNIFTPKIPDLMDLHAAAACEEKDHVRIIGNVQEVKAGVSKKGTPYFKMVLVDEKASMTCMIFKTKNKDNINECELINGRLPREKDIVVCSGQKVGDAVFLDSCGIQDISVWLKVSQIED